MKKLITAMLLVIFLISTSSVTGVNVEYTNYKLDGNITIDGKIGDWADMEPATITLKPARVSNEANASISAEFYSLHDTSKIYFLVVVKNDPYYFYNWDAGIAHRYAPALAISFPIDEGAKAEYMGGSGRDTMEDIDLVTGKVDIIHWELDTKAGVTAGGTKNTTAGASFGDGIANLDDEYAESAEDRSDDNDPNSENSLLGAWGFSVDSPSNGTAGDWYFEISRDITNNDPHDAQFAEGETIDVAIAYWTPNEHTNKKWTDDGHYVNYDNVIEMTLDSATGPSRDDDSPGFGLIVALSGIFVIAVILKKRN